MTSEMGYEPEIWSGVLWSSMIGNGQGETEIPVGPAKQVPRASKGFWGNQGTFATLPGLYSLTLQVYVSGIRRKVTLWAKEDPFGG